MKKKIVGSLLAPLPFVALLPGDAITPDVVEGLNRLSESERKELTPTMLRDFAVAVSRFPEARRAELLADDESAGEDELPPDLALELVRVMCERTGQPYPTDVPPEAMGTFWYIQADPHAAQTLGALAAVAALAAETGIDEEAPDIPAIPKVPIRREGPKVSRNDPCPCGSGRKYKKCHLGREGNS